MRWIELRHGRDRAYAPYADFGGSAADAMKRFAASTVVLIGSECAAVREAAPKVTEFALWPLIERPGWAGSEHFALPDGRVLSASNSKKPIVLFQPIPQKCVSGGTPTGWKSGVCRPLVGQHLCVFTLMTMFAPPLLDLTDRTDNYGFEIVGDPGIGKSTLQLIISSAAGGALPSAPGQYWVDCNVTVNALEAAMVTHSDHPLIMEEAALFAAEESKAKRAALTKALIFRMSAGTNKGRFGSHTQVKTRMIYILSSNRSNAKLLSSGHALETDAAADRLITLDISENRPHGIFDFLPPEFGSGSEFSAALKRAAGQNYGLAFPQFIKCLVNRRSTDEAKLRRWITRQLDHFRTAVDVDADNGSELRVADAFGLSFAAGKLAQRFKILPAAFDCLDASIACYKLHRKERTFLQRLPDRLLGISKMAGVVVLDREIPELSKVEFYAVPAFVRTTRAQRTEILFTRSARDRFFPDFDAMKRDWETQGWFKSENGRDTVRRVVRNGKGKEALFRFYLPPTDKEPDNTDGAE